MTLATQADIRIYFVGEGATYKNTLGFNTTGGSVTPSSDSQIIFPNVSSGSVRSSSTPLVPGDFVNMGRYDAGTTLDFFTIANGASSSIYGTYTGHTELNPDRRQHMVAFAVPSSPFLLIGFEDTMNGGDNDLNDVLFAVDIGAVNQQSLAGSEPGTILLMAGFLTTTIAARRRKTALVQA